MERFAETARVLPRLFDPPIVPFPSKDHSRRLNRASHIDFSPHFRHRAPITLATRPLTPNQLS